MGYNYYINYDHMGSYRMCVHGEQEPVRYSDAWFRKYTSTGSFRSIEQFFALGKALAKVNLNSKEIGRKILTRDTELPDLSKEQMRAVSYWIQDVIKHSRFNFLPVEQVEAIYNKN